MTSYDNKTAVQRVSVIIPTFNRSAMFRETLESVSAQTFRDLEVIVVDDGSTDDTERHRVWAESEFGGRLTWISQRNAGEPRAVNRGWEVATGEYVVVVSSDDPQPPLLIESNVVFLDQHPDVLVCYPDWEEIDDEGRVTADCVSHDDFDLERLFVDLHCFPGPGAMIRRTSVARFRPTLRDLRYPLNSDLECWLDIASRGRIVRNPALVARYRRHQASTSATFGSAAQRAAYLALVDEFYLRPGLPAEIASLAGRARRRQLAMLAHTVGPRLGSSLLTRRALAVMQLGPRESARTLERRVRRRLGRSR